MTEPRRYRRLRWPHDRPGIRPIEAARLLGIAPHAIYDHVEDGTIAIWIDPVKRGVWVDADEVEELLRRQGGPISDAEAG